MENLEGLLENTLKELRASKRQRVRATLTNRPADLAEQVGQYVFEFHQEYLQLMDDHQAALVEVEKLTTMVTVLQKDVETLSNMRRDHRALLESIRGVDLCSNCSHTLQCDWCTCTHCAQYICGCCRTFCRHPPNSEEGHTCYAHVCKACAKKFSFCPDHCVDFDQATKEEKMQAARVARRSRQERLIGDAEELEDSD